jgi:glucose/mannose transport system substrate-binding protein
MPKFKVLAGACLMSLAAGLAAPVHAEELKAEVMHFWVSGGEAAAIKVVADAFNKRGGTWIDNAVAGGDAAKQAGISRIQGGNPPTAMMWNIGVDVTELAANGMLNSVDSVAKAENWQSFLPPSVWKNMVYEDHVVAVPLNIHGENWIYGNAKVLADAGIEMPKTWDDFFAAADKLKAKGVMPIAIGGQPWQYVIILRAIVAGESADFYRKVFVDRDEAAAASPEMRKAFEILARVKALADTGSPGRKWNDATNLVITGKAGFNIMGDWAKGEFTNAGQTPGKDYLCALPPGDGTGYIIAVDAFTFPKTEDATAIKAQALLAETMMDKDVQVDFNKLKGSVPVRLDVDPSNFDDCGKLAFKILSDPANQLPNAALALSGDMEGGIEDLVGSFWTEPNPDLDATVSAFAAVIAAK